MKRVITLIGVPVVALVTVVLAQGGADFSGTWVFNKEKSDPPRSFAGAGAPGGGGSSGPLGVRDPDRPIVIKQTQTDLSVEYPENAFVYKLDGSEKVNRGASWDIISKSRWEGTALVTESRRTLSGPRGMVTITTTERRTLSADGATMAVEYTSKTPRGTVTRRLVFDKQQ